VCKIDSEYYDIVKDVLENEEFLKRKNFKHHGITTVYDHSLAVSMVSYKIAKKFKFDYKVAAIAGLLHDFYDKPWQEVKDTRPFFKKHGFAHAGEALVNARVYFPELLNLKTEDSICRHMFPLNIRPPKYKEGWIITLADKYVSMEVFKDVKNLPRYIGIFPKEKH
jgi:uncharacterized protein